MYLDKVGDKTWLRSRTVVITFEECWPLAGSLLINPELSSKRKALLLASRSVKQKDAASLGALAYAYQEGDASMMDCVPDSQMVKIVSGALKRPVAFFEWIIPQCKNEHSLAIIHAAQKYLPVATWQWDKGCILAGALLSTMSNLPIVEQAETPEERFPFWVALDKHTPQGKLVLKEIATQQNISHRQLIWASFYFESARVNYLVPSPWWEAEKAWRFRRAGISVEFAEGLWARVSPFVRDHLKDESAMLQKLIEDVQAESVSSSRQDDLF
ncbi:MAG: hypothetical protein WBZ48_08145 [Bacteroidota bacterium]